MGEKVLMTQPNLSTEIVFRQKFIYFLFVRFVLSRSYQAELEKQGPFHSPTSHTNRRHL